MPISAAANKPIVSVFYIFLNSQASAHLPYEFTVMGMLERLNAYIEYQVCIVDHFHFKKCNIKLRHRLKDTINTKPMQFSVLLYIELAKRVQGIFEISAYNVM